MDGSMMRLNLCVANFSLLSCHDGPAGVYKTPCGGGERPQEEYRMWYDNQKRPKKKKTLGGRETRPCLAQSSAGE
jgi:hypothetical protein